MIGKSEAATNSGAYSTDNQRVPDKDDWQNISHRMKHLKTRLSKFNGPESDNESLRSNSHPGNSRVEHSKLQPRMDLLNMLENSLDTTKINDAGAIALPQLGENEYEYVWDDGSLGLSFKKDKHADLPYVHRLTGSSTNPKIHRIELGDFLIYVNERSTAQCSISETMLWLKSLHKPVILRFKARKSFEDRLIPELNPNEYEILWEKGTSLGISIGDSKGHLIVKGVKANLPNLELLVVERGDELIMANDRSSADIGYDAMRTYLSDAPKPAILRFRRSKPRSNSCEPPRTVVNYHVKWNTGSLGVTFKKQRLEDGTDVPKVSRLTGTSTDPVIKESIRVGDYLMEIGPFVTCTLGFENSTKLLQTIGKPVLLKFLKQGSLREAQ